MVLKVSFAYVIGKFENQCLAKFWHFSQFLANFELILKKISRKIKILQFEWILKKISKQIARILKFQHFWWTFQGKFDFLANLNKFWHKYQRTERISAKISNFNKFRPISPNFLNFERKCNQLEILINVPLSPLKSHFRP